MAEAVGTCLLLTAVVGSGIMAERLSGGNVGLALLANSVATGAALVTIILVFGPISGAHLNPAVTLVEVGLRRATRPEAVGYMVAQLAGALLGVLLAHAMFGLAPFSVSQHARGGTTQILSEAVATFGLVVTILRCARSRPTAIPFAVGLYITAAYWFTASTSFANPAVTIARTLTDTFTGIRPGDAPGFITGQILGAGAGAFLFRWFDRDQS
jgi:glycerol uptake facilitator-like aquaporin